MLPSARGAVIERAERICAAFHGAIAPTTPTGWRIPIAMRPGVSVGSTCPIGAYGIAAAWRSSPGTKWSWNIAKPNVLPVSRARRSTTSSPRLSRMSAALRKIACLVSGEACDHAGKAAAAASTARRASSRVARASRGRRRRR